MTTRTPSAVARRIADCVDEIRAAQYEKALIHLFPAMDATAKKRRPRAGVGERMRGFVADQEDIISMIGIGNVMTNLRVNGVTFPEAIYKFGRISILHEGELDQRLRIVPVGTLTIGDVWTLPSSYVAGMMIAVVSAKENTGESLGRTDPPIALFGRPWQWSELWGGEAELRAAMIPPIPVAFPHPGP